MMTSNIVPCYLPPAISLFSGGEVQDLTIEPPLYVESEPSEYLKSKTPVPKHTLSPEPDLSMKSESIK